MNDRIYCRRHDSNNDWTMSLALKRTAEKLADDSVGEERMGGITEGAGTRR